MSQNIEIKARHENLLRARELALAVGAKAAGVDHQIDTYFRVPEGRLKIRESSLSGAWLVPYIREEISGPKSCRYALVPLADGKLVIDLLRQILGITIRVEKRREILLFKNVRIHLDQVQNLGNFIELEAVCSEDVPVDQEHIKIRHLMESLEIDHMRLEIASYQELLVIQERARDTLYAKK